MIKTETNDSRRIFKGVLEAYRTQQTFLEKIASPNELYQADFLEGIKEAQDEAKSGRFEEVGGFEEFVQ